MFSSNSKAVGIATQIVLCRADNYKFTFLAAHVRDKDCNIFHYVVKY